MEEALYIKERRKALRLCIPYILITFFFYHIDKFLSDHHWSVVSLILLTYIEIFGYFTLLLIVMAIGKAYGASKPFQYKIGYAVLVYVIAILFALNFPHRWSSEMFESKTVYRAVLRGTVSHVILTLRQNHKYELNNSALGMSGYAYGKWEQKADTIFLSKALPESNSSPFLKDTMVIERMRLRDYYEHKDSNGHYFLASFSLTDTPSKQ